MDENLFRKVPVKVQNKSGFDLSFQNLLTTKVGTITPVVCEELMPNETIHLKAAIQAQLPPLASDTFMRCDLKYEAFFCPTRLVMKNYQEWLVPGSQYGSSDTNEAQYQPRIPLVRLYGEEIKRGSLADYLGYKAAWSEIGSGPASAITSATTIADVNALPFLAYHRIYNDWYRNTLVQKPIYNTGDGRPFTGSCKYNAANSTIMTPCAAAGYVLCGTSNTNTANQTGKGFADGSKLTDLRQRNFGYDYFTTATPSAQKGTEQGIVFSGDTLCGFTINQLRTANAIQMWNERQNLAGADMVEYLKAMYGANLSYGVAQKPILLGSGSFAVYSKGIFQNSPDGTSVPSQNPFNSVGAKYGSAIAAGSETLVDSFTAMEPGYLFVLCTLVPKQTYGTGVDRKLIRYTGNDKSDMANPMLQGIGNQPVYTSELSNPVNTDTTKVNLKANIFGFQERYADWKSKNDEVHGLLRDNVFAGDTAGTLKSFALQSTFDLISNPQISTDFLKIPVDYLDQVAAVDGAISRYGCWIDSYFDFKASMPLARYALPTLQDPAYEHGESVVLDRGGKRL